MSILQATDHKHLDRAIDIAAHGRGATSPNPLVGAVIVKDGRVVGEGFHAEIGGSGRTLLQPNATAVGDQHVVCSAGSHFVR